MKLDVLAIGAHPDDVELGAGGTMAALMAQGKITGIVDLTRGEAGTRGDAETRKLESDASAVILGLAVRDNLDLGDSTFDNTHDNRLKVVQSIRRYRPEILLCNAITDRHTDHGRAATLVEEAAFISGLAKIETWDKGQTQPHWRPRLVLHYIQDRFIQPDMVMDITPFYETKMACIKAFKSQFYDENDYRNELRTAISGKDFISFLEGRAREMGRIIGVEFGEGFTMARAPGIRGFDEII